MLVQQFIKSYGAVKGEIRFKIKIKLANFNVGRSFLVWHCGTIYDIDFFLYGETWLKSEMKRRGKFGPNN